MSFLDKLMFWKKDEFDFDKPLDTGKPVQDDLGLKDKSAFPAQPDLELGVAQRPAQRTEFTQPPHKESGLFPRQQAVPPVEAKELELISSKLDTLKALLVSLDQRVANLERAAGVERKERLW